MTKEYSAFRNKRRTAITMDEEMYKRAEAQLYALHGYLVQEESRPRRCHKKKKRC